MANTTIDSNDLNELWLDATTTERWFPSNQNPDSGPVCLVEPHLLQKLINAYRAAEKDADRYRWLRAAYAKGNLTYIAEGLCTEDQLDEEIDTDIRRVIEGTK